MNVFNKIKNRINENLTTESSEDGFSMIEGVMGIAIMSVMTVVGVGSVNNGGITEIFDNAKQAQTASLLRDTMTNIVFYDIDGDSDTTTQYAIDEFNKVNQEKGFIADYRQDENCLAIQIMADNGINSIRTEGKDCESFVDELNKQSDALRKVSDSEANESGFLASLINGDN